MLSTAPYEGRAFNVALQVTKKKRRSLIAGLDQILNRNSQLGAKVLIERSCVGEKRQGTKSPRSD